MVASEDENQSKECTLQTSFRDRINDWLEKEEKTNNNILN